MKILLGFRFVAPRVGAQAQVFFHAQINESAASVGHMAYAHAHNIFRCLGFDTLAQKVNLSLGLHHAADGAQQGSFPRAVRTEYCRDAALFHGKANAEQHLSCAVACVEFFCAEYGSH